MYKKVQILFSDVILRPGFIYGNRRVGNMELPLGVIGSPLEMVPKVLIVVFFFWIVEIMLHPFLDVINIVI